ncbi:hypothetical protein PRUPE_3G236500 [Prunus persica]|uniref:Uncharacterized protein n=1 Tax=Prunus persica TaxID=3760 RepID=A0A251Q4I2_PRUPE|nr:hypothetical protein PRUPE_3G236500 [Prunus persica]
MKWALWVFNCGYQRHRIFLNPNAHKICLFLCLNLLSLLLGQSPLVLFIRLIGFNL